MWSLAITLKVYFVFHAFILIIGDLFVEKIPEKDKAKEVICRAVVDFLKLMSSSIKLQPI